MLANEAYPWIELQNRPSPYNSGIANVLYHKNHSKFLIVITEIGDIFRYSPDNKWKKSYHAQLYLGRMETVMNWETNQIITYNRTEISAMRFNEEGDKIEWRNIKQGNFDIPGSSVVVIRDKLHIIGGYLNIKHLAIELNEETNKGGHILHENVVNKEIVVNYAKCVRAGNYVLIFGGFYEEWLDSIHQYSISDNSWKRLKVTMPKPMRDFGVTSIMDGRYVLLFGGRTENEDFEHIYIYSVHDETFRLSKVVSPKKGKCHVIAVNDKEKEELSVHGFVRYQWRYLQINEQLFLPKYLVQIIRRYYHQEFIHLVSIYGHWKIDVFDIIQ